MFIEHLCVRQMFIEHLCVRPILRVCTFINLILTTVLLESYYDRLEN